MNPVVAPPLLERFVNMQFYNECNTHFTGDPKSVLGKCNMFCLDCHNVQAICSYCQRLQHDGHRVLQLRRFKDHDVVMELAIKDVFDIRDVQTYKFSSCEKLVYLKERSHQAKRARVIWNSNAACKNCGRTLLDSWARFCSLGCKLVGTNWNVNAEEEEHQEEDNTMVAPPWLENLVNVQFLDKCSAHGKCDMFCLDCNDGAAFCSNCRRDEHNDHKVLQIKRFRNMSGDEYAVSASEIPADLSANVQTSKNGEDDDVVFLRERTLFFEMLARGCEICRRTINDDHARFCSLSCKLEGIKRNANNA